ncbi:MAG: hypothetical protein ACD_50C00175G0005 [uncultured bacterium]|nr:MAG: hypothetical protein ACD_50C00175G0005 [uncultured bacterium]OGH13600.1 MAG: hypothetical protein A2687_05560 [Candidatus Levybacteria bacterium RIFCSPHIGHO2_01_FULL_38_26]
MVCIRIFRTRKEAELAKRILEEDGIRAVITEDKFNDVPIDSNVPSRFRLKVGHEDFENSAHLLANKLRRKRL